MKLDTVEDYENIYGSSYFKHAAKDKNYTMEEIKNAKVFVYATKASKNYDIQDFDIYSNNYARISVNDVDDYDSWLRDEKIKEFMEDGDRLSAYAKNYDGDPDYYDPDVCFANKMISILPSVVVDYDIYSCEEFVDRFCDVNKPKDVELFLNYYDIKKDGLIFLTIVYLDGGEYWKESIGRPELWNEEPKEWRAKYE